jgi:polyhydroxybutyrate depolymerase
MSRASTWRSLALLAALLLAGCAAAATNLERRAVTTLVERPPSQTRPLPLIIVLHGAGLNGRLTRNLMHLPALARDAGFAVAFPDAAGLTWNDGSIAGEEPGVLSGPDDVGFLDALIDRLVVAGVADPQAIHLVGISNGGMMAAHYACLRAGRLASVILFKATMPPPGDRPCRPVRPLPVLLAAGTEDPVVRWDGSVVLGGIVTLQRRRSIPDSFAFWREANGCTGEAPAAWLPQRGPPGAPRVLVHQALGCRDGVSTLLYEVRGGGHRLPGGEELSVLRVLGRATQDVEASALILAFATASRKGPN